MCVCVCGGRQSQIEIITLPIVSHSIMRQRCVFARDGDEGSAASGFSRSYMACNGPWMFEL